MTQRIKFFEPWEPYGWLTALSEHPVEAEGFTWPTAEHYYQASKYSDADIRAAIRQAPDAHAAKVISKTYKPKADKNWSTKKLAVMRAILRLKFQQHPNLAAQLCATQSAELIEANMNDAFWGNGADGRGANWFGRILMEIRAELTA